MSGSEPQDRSDEALVQAFRCGEDEAFTHLYQRHAGAVAVTARGRGAPDHAVADVVQETFVRAIARLAGLRQPARFRSWLLAIARNATADLLRRRVELAVLDADGDHRPQRDRGVHDDRIAATDPTPDQLVELSELSALLSGCLAGLSVRDATALTMVSQLGFGTSDVSAALGIADGATKVLLHRARRRLRDAVVQELLVRVPAAAAACAPYREIASRGDDREAARHVRSCPACQATARDQLDLR